MNAHQAGNCDGGIVASRNGIFKRDLEFEWNTPIIGRAAPATRVNSEGDALSTPTLTAAGRFGMEGRSCQKSGQ
jgi:hypothetical protein